MWNLSHYIFKPELNGLKENPLNNERIKKAQYDYGLSTPTLITSLVMKHCLLAMIFLFSKIFPVHNCFGSYSSKARHIFVTVTSTCKEEH